ncbi:hypothetical protein ASE27_02930 [Oerskovia sp. Root918]|uniref:hypothetical protein n=1 Tax=unclassified Oerskovia TaxID=2619021 RepID=UPI0006F42219|nr:MULTISPECIES: hypothetical protein [unclassified Oerskovia]KRC42540.1 hypothetical protein ASE15_00235 [Oerskovia sp. Root22]KRD47324.1 hypothetical protein ASE27_02930 [Oerskovia sp. Root918]
MTQTEPITPTPGKTLGIVALVLSIPLSLVGLVLGIVGLVKARRAHRSNWWAVAAIIVSFLVIVAIVIWAATLVWLMGECAELGPGIHEVDGRPIECVAPAGS